MGERKVRISGAELVPELPHAELVLPHIDIVQEHHAPGAQLPEPGLEVVPYRLVGMEPVDVKEVDTAGLEVVERLVEGRAHETGKARIACIVIAGELVEYVLPVEAGVRVAAPGVDRETPCIELQPLHRLGEGGIGVAAVRAKLDQQLRPMRIDDPKRKGNVPDPGGRADKPVRIVEDDWPTEDVRINGRRHGTLVLNSGGVSPIFNG